jgi:di/tricarboxylate transporter
MNPITMLTQSRKFWLLVLDVALSLILYFTGKYLAPAIAEDVNFVIGAMQPVFVAVIAGIFIEDAALKRSGNWNRE